MTCVFFELIVTCLQLTQQLRFWTVRSESFGYCSLEEFFTFLGDSSESVIFLVESLSLLPLCESLVLVNVLVCDRTSTISYSMFLMVILKFLEFYFF